MRVRLIASTLFDTDAIDDLMRWGEEHISQPDSGDMLAEFAGRTCYLSYNRPNPKTFTNQEYLANIIEQQHFSVLEHSSASFYVDGVSRALLIELERHRHLSLSVVSTRYVDARKMGFVIPPALRNRVDYNQQVDGVVPPDQTQQFAELADYLDCYEDLRSKGKSMKQAREAAAYFLPNGLETRFVVTGNFRAWRDVIGKRNADGANAEIRDFAQYVLSRLKFISPNSFQDMEV